ncbi:MAG: peptide chain release factor 1 [Oligoflexales bacterium]|nr:peptide chain release factor 1 [Oligoflexales bacterium]
MFEKLEAVEERFRELENDLSQEGLSGAELTRLSKERGEIAEIVQVYREYKKRLSDHDAAREMLKEKDPDIREIAREELETLLVEIKNYEEQLQVLTLPKDPNDEKNVILEIRAGTGGDEAALFASDLLRMYLKYADSEKWKTEILSVAEGTVGGYKEVVVLIQGQKVYSRLKFESGVHRVQRVPVTEAQGRIHTSACTVAILPEADDVSDIEINPKDLEITTSRSSGAGGQHVNTTDSAIRIVHVPSGVVVECQAERSQHKNKERALKVLKAKLLELARREQESAISADRKGQVGSGDRSEKIRTYNFPQGRMTDHRINMTLYKLDAILNGDLNDVLDGLAADHQTRLLKEELSRV